MHDRIRNLPSKLPERERSIVRAVFVENRDKDEVCREFEIDWDYLRVWLYRFKKLIDPDRPPEGGDGMGVPVGKLKVY